LEEEKPDLKFENGAKFFPSSFSLTNKKACMTASF
jgi:hypothetical protein